MKRPAAAWPTVRPTSDEPVKEMAWTLGVLDDAGADLGAGSGDDVDHARRNSGIDQRLDQIEGGERGVHGGLDDAGVAADQRGQELPGGDGHGEVPGGDHAADADRQTDAHGEFVAQLGRSGDAEEAAAFAGHVEGSVDGFLDVAAGFGEHFAHLAGHVLGVLLLTLEEDLAGTVEDFGAFGGGSQPPGFEGLSGGGNGSVDVLGGGGLELANDVVVAGGVDIEEGFAGAGGDPLAADEVLVGFVRHAR